MRHVIQKVYDVTIAALKVFSFLNCVRSILFGSIGRLEKYSIRGLTGIHELVDFFHRARLGDSGIRADFGPEHAHQYVAVTGE